ncbi:MAG: hypothetical protein M0R06_01280 [Sphaerochaeta sp.]|jgi:hypothetical protein|nr:hypothetical protein [Sphaerochaeta sp.]
MEGSSYEKLLERIAVALEKIAGQLDPYAPLDWDAHYNALKTDEPYRSRRLGDNPDYVTEA